MPVPIRPSSVSSVSRDSPKTSSRSIRRRPQPSGNRRPGTGKRRVRIRRVVVVTGLSGAGKSQAMKSFEDLGFHCVDRLPPRMAPEFLALCVGSGLERVALSLTSPAPPSFGDAPQLGRRTSHAISRATAALSSRPMTMRSCDAIARRAGRRHPFEEREPVLVARRGSRPSVWRSHRSASARIWSGDSSSFTHARLKAQIASLVDEGVKARLSVHRRGLRLRHGLPTDADIVFDVRFLPNPHYEPELSDPHGSRRAGRSVLVKRSPATSGFLERVQRLIDFCIPLYLEEGKTRLTITIGCTGGRHRSVYVARRLAAHLHLREELAVTLEQRDVTRR